MSKNKSIITSLVLLLLTLPVAAVPAKPEWVTVTLTDGTQVEVMPCGDEFGHYFVTSDGRYLTMDANKQFSFISSLSTFYQEKNTRRASAERARKARLARRLSSPSPQENGGGRGISRHGLIILVAFEDQSFLANAQTTWNRMANEEGYHDGSAVGSIHDYFLDQSYNKFNLTFDVVGPVNLDQPYAHYGKNDSKGEDGNVGEMVRDACLAVDDEVDFSQYDWDGDGEVDQVFFIYAGFGENEFSSTMPDLIWPHSWELDDWNLDTGKLILDGTHINTYACTNEQAAGRKLSGIGTACHEFAHCFGLPDLYNTNTGKDIVMGSWDIMSTGCYNNRSWRPAAFSAYERYYCGWLTLTELNAMTAVNAMPSIEEQPTAYLVRNDAINPYADEYYIIENRQPVKWDCYLPGSGLLVWHIDYKQKAWDDNTINNTPSHYRIDIIAAGGSRTAGDAAYPTTIGGTLRNALTDTTTPAATIYNPAADGSTYMGKPITDIAILSSNLWGDKGKLAYFRFMDNGLLTVDANCDGIADVGDVMAVINSMSGTPTPEERYHADTNGDGTIDVGDIMAIINYMAEALK